MQTTNSQGDSQEQRQQERENRARQSQAQSRCSATRRGQKSGWSEPAIRVKARTGGYEHDR